MASMANEAYNDTPTNSITFLAATGQLYKRVCRLVGRLVCWSVGLLVLFSFLSFVGAVAAYEVLTSLVKLMLKLYA